VTYKTWGNGESTVFRIISSKSFVLSLLVTLAHMYPASALAVTFPVDTHKYSYRKPVPGLSLKEAIVAAEGTPGPDTIEFNMTFPATIALA
jgi:hypothetical protein